MKTIYTLLILFTTNLLFAQQYYQVSTDVLNVRSSESKNSEIIFKFNLGDSVYVTKYSNEWSQVKLNNGGNGYVSSNYISSDFKTYSKASTTETKKEKTSVWGTLGFLAFIFLIWFFKGSSKGKDNTPFKQKQTYSKTQNISIADIKDDGHWLRVYNSDGKQLSVRGKGNKERLLGYSDRIIVLEDGHWLRVFSYNFNQISVRGKSHDNDYVKGVTGHTITIQEGHWIRTYNKDFKLINTRS